MCGIYARNASYGLKRYIYYNQGTYTLSRKIVRNSDASSYRYASVLKKIVSFELLALYFSMEIWALGFLNRC